jgi:ribosomal-protein-serine acetyltransferase
MKATEWKCDRITDILSEEFYELIRRNESHIEKTFPVTLNNCSSAQKTADFIEKCKEAEVNGTGYYFYVRNIESEKLIGYVAIKNIDQKIAKCELAYFVDKDFVKIGVTSVAVGKVIDFCFGDLKMNKVFISTSPINIASQNVAIKHGFQKEGLLREEFKNGQGILEDIVYFGLLRSEYNER